MSNPRLAAVDALIRKGKGGQARRELKKLALEKIPRGLVLETAALARRAHLSILGIRLLNPIVRPSGKLAQAATDREKAEYAACLTYVGAAEEALVILREIDENEVPQSLLYAAFGLFAQWEYAAAIPILMRYVRMPGLTGYQRLVGKVNLASALQYERQHRKAETLLRQVTYEASLRGMSLVLGNALQQGAANFVLQRKWKDADACLEKAERLLGETEAVDALFVDKWRAIARALRNGGRREAVRDLRKVRAAAIGREHWETVRDCDRFLALATGDEALLVHVYFGTPHPSFRQRLLGDFGRKVVIPESYAWRLGSKGTRGPALDLLTGQSPTPRGEALKVGSAGHRLLGYLSSDFYRPFRLAGIHGYVFPGDFFNPTSSPHRVGELMRRLRAWLEDNRLPLAIEFGTGFYRLASAEGCSLLVPSRDAPVERSALLLDSLRQRWPVEAFSLKEAGECLAMPSRSAFRILEKALKDGVLLRTGAGPKTRYRFGEAARAAVG